MGLIYCATNKVNGKKYIGLTTKTLDHRRREHEQRCERGDKSKFINALRKYGKSNFEWCELEGGIKGKEKLGEKEVDYIKKYDTMKNGYNTTSGGHWLGKGEEHPSVKYSDELVREIIKDICDTNLTYTEIANKKGVKVGVVIGIASKTTRVSCWDGRDNPRELKKIKVLTEYEVKGVIKDILNNKTKEEIMEERGVKNHTVDVIRRGVAHRDKWDDFENYDKNKSKYAVNNKVRNTGERTRYGDDLYKEIKERVINTEDTYTKIAKDLGVKYSVVDSFVNLRVARHVWGDDKNPRKGRNSYTKEDFEDVFIKYYIEGLSTHDIVFKTKFRSKTTVGHFVSNKTHRDLYEDFKLKYKGKNIRDFK